MGRVALLIVALVLLFGASTVAGYVIEYQWWQEMGQADMFDMLWYGWHGGADDGGVPDPWTPMRAE